ncbi:MAG: helix-turn-helix domain-containing protein [Clostridia bacterium]|nr:helix-turn-helix domain-containing protein [Clostridia bacterium]
MITLERIQIRLAEAIKQSGMTQSELAKKLGVKHQQISCYIKGQKMPAIDTLANLCKILDVDTNYILCQD